MKIVQSLLTVVFLYTFAASAGSTSVTEHKTPLLTRTVVIFSALEAELIDALKNNNQSKLEKLLANDFEMRQMGEPESPIPRTNWLANSLAEASKYTSDIEQMTVHDLNQATIVNFLWSPVKKNEQRSLEKVFVVDVWRQKEKQWQLAIRYISSAQNPNAKIPGFVPTPNEMVIEKRY
jgi:hypothetical protein